MQTTSPRIMAIGKVQNGVMTLTTDLNGTPYTKEVHIEAKSQTDATIVTAPKPVVEVVA